MTHLVRQLLDFARRKGPQKRELELGAMARHVTGVLATMARKRGVGLVSETPAEAYVDADPTMIEQVLTNLVFNAIQASPKGARAIRVSTTTCSLSEPPAGRPRGDYARVRVEDHGDGIEPENVARIFEPFFTTKDVGEGTGLGLSVSYGIVEDHGGFMDVSSQLGVGTTFDVYLPAGQHGHVS
ncbi:MAG: HAMP domain-containing histidine kinase [Polyangiaceae bacterium]|nr:HAMP domain-containing histidine kinase [Polyangiaceae bacterium]